ncbi:MAG: glutathione-dependent formaldehyde dehydrogenase [Candidatus Sericytochromatia bacterium]|nr:glutathione-dependent formaldehyde dehydrogenase [Candidatus Sericytochromatia bacterium]
MRAVCWRGVQDVRVQSVPDPRILNPRDAIIRVTATAICGSDLHLYDGCIPTMRSGDILGHETMGEVVEVGPAVKNVAVGDRVVASFPISCGHCWYCEQTLFSLCDNSNPNAPMTEKLYGAATAGIYGFSHLMGGYAGGQAEYLRVPFADVGLLKLGETNLSDEQVLFLSDILPTAYMAAENCSIRPGDTVAVWGCGPVGQLTIKCAYLLGAERVIAIDEQPERLAMARQHGKADTIDHLQQDTLEALAEMTGGRGPDACIDAVGMEAHGTGIMGLYDRTKQAVYLETDRPNVLREAIHACRKGGTVSVPGVYGGYIDKVPIGAAFNKGLTFKMGQTHVQRYMQPLLDRINAGEIDPSFIITHRLNLDDAAAGYRTFQQKADGCIKVVLKP